ncbi:MAG: M56 family metallopeptidase [Pirellulaceae bacterium]|nr:M56 family metallopeptidase [Pirellulaceae bacterium]
MNHLIEFTTVDLASGWSHWADAVVFALLHFLWQGAAAGLLLWLVLRSLQDRVSPHGGVQSLAQARYLLSCGVLFSLPCLVVFNIIQMEPNSVWSSNATNTAIVMAESSRSIESSQQPSLRGDGVDANDEQNRLDQDANQDADQDGSQSIIETNSSDDARKEASQQEFDQPANSAAFGLLVEFFQWVQRHSPWLLMLYLCGVSLMLIRLACGFYQTWRWRRRMILVTDGSFVQLIETECRRMGMRLAPLVGTCDRILVPMVVGIFRPAILLPATFMTGLSTDQVAAILRHELSHIHRLDPLVNLLQRIVESVLFFHPITWWISKQVDRERENCCDDVVSREVNSLEYATALLQMAERSAAHNAAKLGSMPAALAADGRSRSGLASRIRRLLGEPEPLAIGWQHLALVALLTVTSLTAIVAIGKEVAQETQDWIRGSGENVALRIHGQVVNPDDSPANDYSLIARVRGQQGKANLETTIDQNGFSAWIDVRDKYAVSLQFQSNNGRFRKSLVIGAEEIRKAAMDGLKIELQPTSSSRTIQLRVVHRGEPVANAKVKVHATGGEAMLETGANGQATHELFDNASLYAFTAWTDQLIGGYQFGRGPTRDSTLDFFEIELFDCRPLRIRLLEEGSQQPVRNAKFQIFVATPQPHFNYLGDNEAFFLVTNSQGEAIFPYWPDWPDHHTYLEMRDPQWVKAEGRQNFPAIDDVMTVTLRRSGFDQRRLATGRLELPAGTPGGFCVELNGDGEEENSSDRLYAYADREGNYSARVLPGATYLAFVRDKDWVSDFQHNVPYPEGSDQAVLPTLTVNRGVPLEIQLTAGPSKMPIRNESVSVISEYEYSSERDGEVSSRGSHRQLFAVTDDSGVAKISVPPGRVEVSCIIQGWSGKIGGVARAGEPLRLNLHRETDGKMPIRIRLIAPEGDGTDLSNSAVIVRSMDPTGREQLDLVSNANGECEFQSDSIVAALGIRTSDGKLGIASAVEFRSEAIEIKLQPTRKVFGRLVTGTRLPLANIEVIAEVSFRDANQGRPFGSLFTFRTTTDLDGNFVFDGVPENSVVRLQGLHPETKQRIFDTEAFVYPGEDRDVESIIVGEDAATKEARSSSLNDQFAASTRQARLGGFHTMVIAQREDKKAKAFIERHFLDYERDPNCGRFVQMVVSLNDNGSSAAFLQRFECQPPADGEILAVVLDQDGKLLEQKIITPADPEASQQTSELMARNLPPQQDALKNWEAAFAEAKRTNRKVWVRISQRYCYPCHLFSAWLEEQSHLLGQDYVMLKVDDVNDLGGVEIFEKISADTPDGGGIPFHVIYHADGTRMIDSNGPLGNIGFPSSTEGKRHLKAMLQATAASLTEQQILQLLETL